MGCGVSSPKGPAETSRVSETAAPSVRSVPEEKLPEHAAKPPVHPHMAPAPRPLDFGGLYQGHQRAMSTSEALPDTPSGNKVRITIIPPTPIHNSPSPSRQTLIRTLGPERPGAGSSEQRGTPTPEGTHVAPLDAATVAAIDETTADSRLSGHSSTEAEPSQNTARVAAFSEQFLDRITREAAAEAVEAQ